ncbi:hypothetical protein JQN59_06170 [Citrobacter sp. B72]|uniref:hypothetical protein n=1 Tax=Citrobacter sp. B72 TaxID=2807631 RepID=UPI0019579E6B|nr:hypothetical protein [Citrobacter sp. B72]QRQ75261.1 hypothetical protein JQN59_06170 [Citrobacter sp. B72]
MTTNNHPAHGPVSLERLHQICEILSKAAAQSDGGNLGYAMADAVKVIDGAIAAFGAEPVAWQWEYRDKRHVTNDQRRAKIVAEDGEVLVQPLYTAPPAPVVPDDGREQFEAWMLEKWGRERHEYDFAMGKFLHGENYADSYTRHMWKAWSASRADMLQAGNSPVTRDGYVLVPIVPTEDMIINGFESVPNPHFSDEKEWEEYEALSGCRQAARRAELCWAAMIKAAPKQENI